MAQSARVVISFLIFRLSFYFSAAFASLFYFLIFTFAFT